MPKVREGSNYNKKYDEELLQKALREIEEGEAKKKVARKYNIPRATLQFRLSNKFKKISHGPNPILTTDEEEMLVRWISDCVIKGFPQRKEDLQASVKNFLDENPRPNPFKDNLPGDGWYKSFLRRHPVLTERQSEGVTPSSANVSESDIRGWFTNIENYLKENDLFQILEDPSRIFNADETNFQLCPKTKTVIAPKGSRNNRSGTVKI
ncbi:chaetoglobosin A biosynthesis cluster protein C-like [Coccinella septempunctata]|uniref:chaetoglobosin A biosynthesis cluster protein C-like n=1 Tax=Coccinella septempunctata TaxID=41139 RepID=UPI001D0804EA|nr:chaetoglobosin A biosynthesis cluster protein C-like [Coccinella septempunctata]